MNGPFFADYAALAGVSNRCLVREIAVAFLRGSRHRLHSIFPELRGLSVLELRALIGR